MLVFSVVFLLLSGIVLLFSLLHVGPHEVVVLNYSFPIGLKPLPPGRIIAREGEQGIRAKYYGPGYHWVLFVHVLGHKHRYPFFEVPEGKFGIVEAVDGDPLPVDVVFARALPRDLLFDVDEFLRLGGQKGPQPWIYQSGKYPYNGVFWKWRLVDRFVPAPTWIKRADNGEQQEVSGFGIVTSFIGPELAEDEKHLVFGKDVEAATDRYQDVAKFLDPVVGGNAGPQPSKITTSVAIHPLGFKIEPEPATFVPPGYVGVRVTSAGEEPTDVQFIPKTDPYFVKPKREYVHLLPKQVVVAGVPPPPPLRGYLKEVYNPGEHFVHPQKEEVVMVPTSPRKICFDDHPGAVLPSIDDVEIPGGYRIGLTAEVIIQCEPDRAPAVVAKFGSFEKALSEFIIPRAGDGIRAGISEHPLPVFVAGERGKVRDSILKSLIPIFRPMHLRVVGVTILNFDLTSDPNTKAFVEAEIRKLNAAVQELAEKARIPVEEARAQANEKGAEADAKLLARRLKVLGDALGDDPSLGAMIVGGLALLGEILPALRSK